MTDRDAPELVVAVVAAEGVVFEFGLLFAVFEGVVVVEESGMVADFVPALIAGAGDDVDAVEIVAFGADDETLEAFVGFGGDFGVWLGVCFGCLGFGCFSFSFGCLGF